MSSATGREEAVARLLEAWRGEIQARAVYTILAGRVRPGERLLALAEGQGVEFRREDT